LSNERFHGYAIADQQQSKPMPGPQAAKPGLGYYALVLIPRASLFAPIALMWTEFQTRFDNAP
jgi:hypothetical protein